MPNYYNIEMVDYNDEDGITARVFRFVRPIFAFHEMYTWKFRDNEGSVSQPALIHTHTGNVSFKAAEPIIIVDDASKELLRLRDDTGRMLEP